MPLLTDPRARRDRTTAAVAVLVGMVGTALALLAGPARAHPMDPPGDTVVIEALDGGALQLSTGRTLRGRVELRRDGDALRIVNDLPFEDYVAGVAEMPASWPEAALEAQAIAARTYAWNRVASGVHAGEGFDICAGTACQVYEGASRTQGDVGARWQAAVDATAGQVLLADGRPILARYFSTSGGRTRANSVVFPATGDLPYLQSVTDLDDERSPYHRWEVRFGRGEFDEILSRGERLAAAVPFADVTSLPGTDGRPRAVLVTGQDGTEVEVGAGTFRTFVSEVAPQVAPDHFPSRRLDSEGLLPATLPSSQVTFTVTPDAVVAEGRGWGHAVGMGQYGAKGKAERGLPADEILAAYYGGLRPSVAADLPARIRVGLGTVGGPVAVTSDGAIRVVVDGVVRVERGYGPHRVAVEGTQLQLLLPDAHGEVLRLLDVAVPASARADAPFEVDVTVTKPALLTFGLRAGERVVATADVVAQQPGPLATVLALPPGTSAWPTGALEVVVEVRDGTGAQVRATTRVQMVAGTPDTADAVVGGPRSSGVASGPGSPADGWVGVLILVGVAVLVLGSLAVFVGQARRDPHAS